MKAILVFACVLLAASAAQAIDFEVDANYTLFTEYMREYRKEYSSMEEMVVRYVTMNISVVNFVRSLRCTVPLGLHISASPWIYHMNLCTFGFFPMCFSCANARTA